MCDPQIGRWFVIDPKVEKYNGVAPYAYALNNPVKYIDPNGKDVRVGIDVANRKITLSSTIFVIGMNAEEQIEKYNKFLKDNFGLLNGIFNDEDGNEWSLSLNISYQVGNNEDKKRIAENPNGDNVLELSRNGDYARAESIEGAQIQNMFAPIPIILTAELQADTMELEGEL